MSYHLYFRDIKVGVITEQETDFPGFWGEITYDASLQQSTTPACQRLWRLIALVQEETRLAGTNAAQDVSQAWETLNAQLAAYQDYIETDDWLLVDESGKVVPILPPAFQDDGSVVWRLNISDTAKYKVNPVTFTQARNMAKRGELPAEILRYLIATNQITDKLKLALTFKACFNADLKDITCIGGWWDDDASELDDGQINDFLAHVIDSYFHHETSLSTRA